jgi:hypothetical protein
MHLARVPGVLSEQRVDSRDALHPFGQAASCQPGSGLVAHVHVVAGFCPVVSDEDHTARLQLVGSVDEPSKAPDTA